MESLSKNQIVSKTHTTFWVWTPCIDPLRVTKKELRRSLKSRHYSVDITEGGTISYGKHKGGAWHNVVIVIS